MQTTGAQQNRSKYTVRALRPLIYWLILVFILFIHHTHQRLSERTRLNFNVFVESVPAQYEAMARVDDQPVRSGDRISIGRHRISITHPKAVPFSTNVFVWYGPHDWGDLHLTRARGVLRISAFAVPAFLSIQGTEWSLSLSNTPVVTETVSIDDYIVVAQYRHYSANLSVHVFASITNQLTVTPRFGLLRASCNQGDASFKLLRANQELVEAGDFPQLITELPEGDYQLLAEHHGHRRSEILRVLAAITNVARVNFDYGVATVATTPAGASVVTSEGTVLGTTPLTVPELEAGLCRLLLKLPNYETVTVAMHVVAGETNIVHTNLVSLSYEREMRRARQFMVAGEFDKASEAVTEALRADPGNAAAIQIQREASGRGSLGRAKAAGSQGDYMTGIKELEKAVAELPDDTEVKQLLTEFKQHEQEQTEREYQGRIEALRKLFDSFTGKISEAALVEVHELKTAKVAKEVQSSLVAKFNSVPPVFKLSHVGWTNGMFYMNADQEVSGGGRLCLVVGAQTKDDETRILFKVIEFKGEALGLKVLGAVLGAATSTKYQSSYQPINPSNSQLSEADKNRLAEGLRNVTQRIEQAMQKKEATPSP